MTDAALAVIIDRLSQSVAFFDGSVTMTKFVFHIRARTGQRADNIVMQANGAAEAERRLRQMHHHCEILECRERAPAARIDALDVEAVIGMISREPLPSGAASCDNIPWDSARSRRKGLPKHVQVERAI